MSPKKIELRFEGLDYLWHNGYWSRNNITVSTSMTQKLTIIALKSGIMSKEDFAMMPKQDEAELVEAKPAPPDLKD